MKPLKPRQKIARSALTSIFELMFKVRHGLRFSQIPEYPNPCVIAVFHDEMIPAAQLCKGRGYLAIASRNHFGYSAGEVIKRLGFDMVYGSPSKGGSEALFDMLAALKEGRSVMLTVDGSRGPRHEMKPGAVIMARKAGVPLYLLRATGKGWRLNSWDRFLIPFPFSHIDVRSEEFPLRDDQGKLLNVRSATAAATERMRQMAEES